MKPTRCPLCHSEDLSHGRLTARSGVSFRPSLFRTSYFTMLRVGPMVAVSGSACLACGAVTPYLDDAALDKVRAWNGKATKVKATGDEL
jgi:hypothetical protein